MQFQRCNRAKGKIWNDRRTQYWLSQTIEQEPLQKGIQKNDSRKTSLMKFFYVFTHISELYLCILQTKFHFHMLCACTSLLRTVQLKSLKAFEEF